MYISIREGVFFFRVMKQIDSSSWLYDAKPRYRQRDEPDLFHHKELKNAPQGYNIFLSSREIYPNFKGGGVIKKFEATRFGGKYNTNTIQILKGADQLRNEGKFQRNNNLL